MYACTLACSHAHSGVGTSCYELLKRGHNTSGLYYLQAPHPSSSHWGAAQKAAEEEEEARVGGVEGGRDEAEIPQGFVGYCDMTTMGGGWLMCYTSRDDVDLANEVRVSVFDGAREQERERERKRPLSVPAPPSYKVSKVSCFPLSRGVLCDATITLDLCPCLCLRPCPCLCCILVCVCACCCG